MWLLRFVLVCVDVFFVFVTLVVRFDDSVAVCLFYL